MWGNNNKVIPNPKQILWFLGGSVGGWGGGGGGGGRGGMRRGRDSTEYVSGYLRFFFAFAGIRNMIF